MNFVLSTIGTANTPSSVPKGTSSPLTSFPALTAHPAMLSACPFQRLQAFPGCPPQPYKASVFTEYCKQYFLHIFAIKVCEITTKIHRKIYHKSLHKISEIVSIVYIIFRVRDYVRNCARNLTIHTLRNMIKIHKTMLSKIRKIEL